MAGGEVRRDSPSQHSFLRPVPIPTSQYFDVIKTRLKYYGSAVLGGGLL